MNRSQQQLQMNRSQQQMQMNRSNLQMNRSNLQMNQTTRIYEENDEFQDVHVYQVLKEQMQFSTTDDQLQIKFEDLEIEEDKITSFGVSFWFTFNNSKFENNDTVFFQIGKNSLQKQMRIGFSKEKSLFVYFKTQSGSEIVYCEKKMYRNKPYFFKISVQQETSPVDVTVYVNGSVEVQQSFSNLIQTPRSCFWIGSEKAGDCWSGSMWDCCFYNKWLGNVEIMQLYADNQDQNQTAVDIINTKQKTQSMSVIQNKRTGVPMNILKTMHQESFQERLRSSQPKLTAAENFQHNLNELSEMIFQNPELVNSIRHLLFNYEWIILTLQLMSPYIESNQQLGQQFHPEFMQSAVYSEIQYPLYIIQMNRLMLVVNKISPDINGQLLVEIAKKLDFLVMDKVYNECVIYDQLFWNLRNICMTKDEILQIKKNYRYDTPELMEPTIIESHIETNDKLQFSFGNQLAKDETLNEIKIQQISARIMKETYVVLEFNVIYKNMRDGSEILCKSVLNTVDVSIVKGSMVETNSVNFGDMELISKMVANFSDKYGYLVGINFYLANGEQLYLGLLIDKDGTTIKTLPDDNIIEKEVRTEYSQFINCIEGQMFQIGEYKFIGNIKSYVCSKQLFDKFAINEQNPINENEELPMINREWLNGRINVYVNYCHMCDQHSNTFIHSENTFVELFNRLGDRLKEWYPNMRVIGNFDKPNKVYENFDVYVKGIGEKEWRDELGRIFMLRKQCSMIQFQKEFDELMAGLEDQIALLVMGYGDTFEIEKMQDLHQSKNPKLYNKYSECKEHPAQFVDPQNKNGDKQKKVQLQNGMLMICRNWGCEKEYKYDDNPTNNKRSCQYHPGAFEFGSINGLWPEQWTCCRKEWTAPGCKIGVHKGIPKQILTRLCLNHGEQNPKTHYPDSYCGMTVKQDGSDETECTYHSGYFISNRITGEERWSCCEPVNGLYTPCVTTTHHFAQWPAEEAKKLFVKKQFIDYSQKDHELQPFSIMAMTSDYFKPVKPYNEAENKRRQYQQKLIDTENNDRYCLNWGCEKTFTLYQNRKKVMCRYHPGRYDFGHTGLTIAQTIGEYGRGESDVIWWKPHWTCCRGEWASRGCQKGRHKGPLVNEMEQRKYKWPSEHAMKYFNKVSSNLWDQKIEKEGILDPEVIGQVLDRYIKKYGGTIPLSEIVKLSDDLKLYILNSSSDLSFHFKFLDVMNNQLAAITEDGSTIDRQKFMNWWFADLETIRPL